MGQFDNDVYISYAHLDDSHFENHKGWVGLFHERLQIRLAQLLGREVKIWRDNRLNLNEPLFDTLTSRIPLARVFICILSPKYVRSPWCLRELEAFCRVSSQLTGVAFDKRPPIFKVLKAPISSSQQPPELEGLIDYEFYWVDQVSGKVRDFIPDLGSNYDSRYWEKLEDIAQEIARALRQQEEPSSSQHTSPDQDTRDYSVVGRSEPPRPLRVFLCHSSNDKQAVRELYRRLLADAVDPWLDEEKLIAGQVWAEEIPRAVRDSDVVVVCLSRDSINKSGYVQKEVKVALDVADLQPEGTIFLIPLRLEECEVPQRLSQYHYVNVFEEKGYERLMRALRARAGSLSITAGAGI